MRITPAYVIPQLILREGQLKKADKELESNLMAAQALLTQHNLLPAPAPTTLNVEVNDNNNRRPQRQYPREGNNNGRQPKQQQPRNKYTEVTTFRKITKVIILTTSLATTATMAIAMQTEVMETIT